MTTTVIILCVLIIAAKLIWVNVKDARVVKLPLQIIGCIALILFIWWVSGWFEDLTGIPKIIPTAGLITYGFWKNI